MRCLSNSSQLASKIVAAGGQRVPEGALGLDGKALSGDAATVFDVALPLPNAACTAMGECCEFSFLFIISKFYFSTKIYKMG